MSLNQIIKMDIATWHSINKTLWELHALTTGYAAGFSHSVHKGLADDFVERLKNIEENIIDLIDNVDYYIETEPEKGETAPTHPTGSSSSTPSQKKV